MNDNARYVAYYRVSTPNQPCSLNRTQPAVVRNLVGVENIIAEFYEQASGMDDDRPVFAEAVEKCRAEGATLVAAYADRLTRNPSFARKLFFESGLEIKTSDLPDKNAENFGHEFESLYFLAEFQVRRASENTRRTLALLKARGVKLGSPRRFTEDEMKLGAAARRKKADENPNNVRSAEEIRRYLAAGNKRNLSAIARHLDAKGCYTSRGVRHDAKSIKLLIRRFGIGQPVAAVVKQASLPLEC